MNMTLLSFPLRHKRDTMIARQRARQLAGLLGFDTQEQAGIAAGVFAIAWQVLHLHAPVELCYRIQDDRLQVFARATGKRDQARPGNSVLCLEKPVPARTKLAMEDLLWAVEKLDALTPAHMYDEVYRLNQELLATLHALHQAQGQLAMQRGEKPSAA